MKTPEQLKGTIRSIAAKRNLRAQEVLQMFLFERILERWPIRTTKRTLFSRVACLFLQ